MNSARTRRFTRVISATLLLALALPCLAANAADRALDCTPPTYDGQLFTRTFNQAKVTAAALCDAIKQELAGVPVDTALLESQLLRLHEVAAEDLASRKLQDPASYADQFAGLKARFTGVMVRNLRLPEFVVKPSSDDQPSTAGFNGIPDGVMALRICVNSAPENQCVATFEDFEEAFNAYRGPFESLFDNTAMLESLSGDWDRFLEVSKSQTALEVILTTWFNRKHFQKDHLVGPPPRQVIALHPDLAYSYIRSKPDGKNDDIGLSVEWLGVNFWNWKVPLGISVATLYFDKAGIKDAGIGAQLHAYNRFSVGWSRHGSKNVYYLNMDLLKLFEEKSQQYKKYLDAYF
jgi:hypothetical protein